MKSTRLRRVTSAHALQATGLGATLASLFVLAGASCGRPQSEEGIGSTSSAVVGIWNTESSSLGSGRNSFSSNGYAIGLSNGDVLFAGGNIPNSSGGVGSGVDLFGQSGFVAKASLPKARGFGGAIALDDGTGLVIGGGQIGGGPTTTAEKNIDRWSSTLNWQAQALLQVARYGAGVTRLVDGRILVVAGAANGAGVVELGSAEIFDPTANTTTLTTGSFSPGRAFGTNALLPNGKVAVIGGGVSAGANPIQIFDPVTQLFTAGPSVLVARFGHASARLVDGRILTCGGCSAPNFCDGPGVNTCEIFDGTTVTATGSMGQGSGFHTMVTLPTKKVLVAGGVNSSSALSRAELYDPDTGTWTPTGSLSVPRYEAGISLIFNGRAVVAGGRNGGTPSGGGNTYLTSGEIFDPGVPLLCKVQQINGTTNTLINGTACDDSNTCTQTDLCANGVCTGTPVANGTACATGTCQAGVCVSADAGTDAPAEAAIDAPADAPAEAAIDAPADAPAEAAIDAPADVPSPPDAPSPTDAKPPIDALVDAPSAADAGKDAATPDDSGPVTTRPDSGSEPSAIEPGGCSCDTTSQRSHSPAPFVAVVFGLLAASQRRWRRRVD